MDKPSDKKGLFQKFIRHQCTEAELEEVWAYIQADQIPAEFEELIRENLEQHLADRRKVSPEVSDRLWQTIQAGTASTRPEATYRKLPRKPSPKATAMPLAIAATVALLLLGGLLYLYFPDLVRQNPHQVYTTTYGETKEVLLPDSSTVVLNANSRLTIASDWTAALRQNEALVREVWLEGEAFFDVNRLARPTRFVVHTDDLKVEVLGTRFDVHSREQKTRVVLDEGKVKLLAENQPELVMNPGELVELSGDHAQFQKKLVNPDTYLAWRHDELIFEATPITEIIDLLEYNYGYEVVIREGVVDHHMLFTGEAPADNIGLLLEMLSETFDIGIVQQKKKIVFQ